MSTPDNTIDLDQAATDQWSAWWAELWPRLRERWCAYLPPGWEPEIRFTPKAVQIGRVQDGVVFHADPNRNDLAILVMGLAAALTERETGPAILVNPDWGLSPHTVMALVRALQDYPGNVMLTSLVRPLDPAGGGASRFRGNFVEVDLSGAGDAS